MSKFGFFGPNLSKKWFRVWNWEKYCRNKNQHLRDTLYANFQPNWKTLGPLVQMYSKMNLGFEIQETNVGIRISILEIPCVPFSDKTGNFDFLAPNFPRKWILGSKFQKSKSGFGISILGALCVTIFRQNGQFWFLAPNLPKIHFGVEISKF